MARSVRVRNERPAPSQEEAIRILRSNLQVLLEDLERPSVIVTSAQAGEGKTTTCSWLAISFAVAGRRTVLIDLDLRHPDAHRVIHASNEVGVTDVLRGRTTADESMQYIEVEDGNAAAGGFYFLGTGPQVDNPTELLSSSRLPRLLATLAKQADVILIDSPPVLPVADTLVIGRMVAGAVLVVEARSTPVPAVLQAKGALIRNQTRLLGLVLNKLDSRDAPHGYGYGYGTTVADSNNGHGPE